MQMTGNTGLELRAQTIHLLRGKMSKYVGVESGWWEMRWWWLIDTLL